MITALSTNTVPRLGLLLAYSPSSSLPNLPFRPVVRMSSNRPEIDNLPPLYPPAWLRTSRSRSSAVSAPSGTSTRLEGAGPWELSRLICGLPRCARPGTSFRAGVDYLQSVAMEATFSNIGASFCHLSGHARTCPVRTGWGVFLWLVKKLYPDF
jgi:hypothetical protein